MAVAVAEHSPDPVVRVMVDGPKVVLVNMTGLPVLLLNDPLELAQRASGPPVSSMLAPAQIEIDEGLIVAEGSRTLTLAVAVAVQPPLVEVAVTVKLKLPAELLVKRASWRLLRKSPPLLAHL